MDSDRSSQEAPRLRDAPSRRRIILEDMLILVAIGALFVLGVFFRTRMWAQITLGVVLAVMLILFVVRVRRMYRAFRAQRDSWS